MITGHVSLPYLYRLPHRQRLAAAQVSSPSVSKLRLTANSGWGVLSRVHSTAIQTHTLCIVVWDRRMLRLGGKA